MQRNLSIERTPAIPSILDKELDHDDPRHIFQGQNADADIIIIWTKHNLPVPLSTIDQLQMCLLDIPRLGKVLCRTAIGDPRTPEHLPN